MAESAVPPGTTRVSFKLNSSSDFLMEKLIYKNKNGGTCSLPSNF